jgi:hypothetical protein
VTALLAYLVLLPLVVWLLGSVFSLLDHEDRTGTLRRIAWRSLPLLTIALLLGSAAARPVAAAFVTVLTLHVAWFFGVRLAIRRGWLAAPAEE